MRLVSLVETMVVTTNDWSGSVADFFLADRMYSISNRPIWLPDRTW